MEKRIQEEQARAGYDAKLAEVISLGRADVQARRVYTDSEQFFDDLRAEMKDKWK